MEGLEARVRARGRQPLASLLKKPSLRLQVIITAACYQEETSDLRSSAPLLLPLLPRLLWDEDKSAVSVCPPYMRFAANCFFYSTLPLLFLLFHPSPHSPTHTTHCIHIFKCKIKLLLCSLAFLSPLNPLPCCVIYYFPFSLDISACSSNEALHCPPRSQSSIKRSEIFFLFAESKENQGWAENAQNKTKKKKFFENSF